MILSTLRAIAKTSFPAMALGAVVLAGPLLPQQAKAQFYPPAYTTTNVLGGSQPTNTPSSFGFFFDVNGGVNIYGLGFAAQKDWGNGAKYTVKLWSWDTGGKASAAPADYTEIATATFTAGNVYTLEGDYYWQTLAGAPLFLADTSSADTGYLIGTIGDFSATPGNVTFEEGIASFDPRIQILTDGNGFNEEDGNLYYPLPVFDGGAGSNGYFNANMSFAPIPPASSVPGPLPLLGAAAGFSWSRRLRKRISASN
jgi:hypothetical protein